jgi:hypothetical protein
MSVRSPDPDPLLHRIERNSYVVCALMTVVAAAVLRPRIAAALGVLGGGVIAAVSYLGVKAGADVLVSGGVVGGSRRRVFARLVKSFTRYGILAGAAYVLMARVRLPPLAVFAGALSVVVAVAIEALSGVVQQRRR